MKLITSLLILHSSIAFAQYQFVSPKPGSEKNTVEHNVIIREGSLLQASSVNENLFKIEGSKSGNHTFNMVLAADQKTIILSPHVSYTFEEVVTVTVSSGLKSTEKKIIPAYTFSFTTKREFTEAEKENFKMARSILLQRELELNGVESNIENPETETRDISGGYIIHKNTDATPGELFFDAWGSGGQTKFDGFNIMKPNGDSVYFSPNISFCTDFDLNANGYLSYYSNGGYKILDSSYNNINTYYAANGFSTDAHEFTMDANGNAWLIAIDYDVVDMKVYDPSYCKDANVLHTVIQQFDKDKNLVFEWNSKDHVDITEAPHENLASCYIDYMHTNSIDIDPDGNIITSNRHLDQINKIDYTTGNFIWRLGGDSNQFVFINEPEPFTYQHCARQLSNGNIILYDNGNFHSPAHTMAKEYQLDLMNKTATLVWSYQLKNFQDNNAYFFAMGSIQRLSSGNTLIGGGWDANSNQSNFFEVAPNGTVVWELELSNVKNLVSYRIAKHHWNPCAPVNPNGITVTKITSTSAKVSWTAVNNATAYDLQYRKSKKTEWKIKNTINLNKKLKNLASNTEYVFQLRAYCTNGHISDWSPIDTFKTLPARLESEDYFMQVQIQVSPNPATDLITLEFETESVETITINIFDITGKSVLAWSQTLSEGRQKLPFNISDLNSGIYLMEVSMNSDRQIIKLVKQ